MDLATEPLITPGTSSVRPNLFFVLDNSGSMNWDYLSDWVVDSTWCKGSTGTASLYCCRNASGSNITSSSTNSTCLPQDSSGTNLDGNGVGSLRGMPLFHSSDFNNIYYNPAIAYTAPKNADGTSKTSYSGSGSVPWDGYGKQYASSKTLTLSSAFPDVEWCTDSTYGDCLRNDNYLLPGTVNSKAYTTMHAVTASGSKAFATGGPAAPTTVTRTAGPYYYAIIPGEYCTTKKLVDCINVFGTTTQSGKTYKYPAKLRWCNNSAGRVAGETGASGSDACQAVKNGTYRYARYPTLLLSSAVAGAAATGKVVVAATPASGSVTLANFIINNGLPSQMNLFGGSSLVWAVSGSSSSTRRNNLANAIVTKINANTASTGFSAASDTASLTGRFRITTPTGTTYNGAAVTVDGDLLSTSSGSPTTVTTSTTMYVSPAFSGGAAASSNSYAAGALMRKDVVSGQTFANLCVDSSGVVTETSSSSCSAGSTLVLDRKSRTDCSAAPSCTYAEELANFANWFAWYRSRMQMAKSSLSIAFQSVDDRYRVGFFTINSSSSNLVNIGQFDSAQKTAWYSKLFDAIPSGGTPLREALANAGRIYSGKVAITGAVDPVQYSCQKNYTILSTDGYWNGNNGYQVNGSTAIANHDGGLDRPELDGRGDSATLADVAAYYYNTDLRNSSLSNCTGALGVSVCTDNVPTTTDDKKTTQHMATYTVGLGIDGVMQFREDYKTPTTDVTDDFDAVRNGTTTNAATGVCPWQASGACNWPQPGSDKQENIDDLWHAAVNGHGSYYSAKDPMGLSKGLIDALSSIGTQIGGAAAATTSNPNVTTGDNFLFSSNYMTAEWTGELVRQTMDLTTGNINSGQDWSAQAQLDATTWSARIIYTFDSTAANYRKLFTWSGLNPSSGSSSGCTPPSDEKGCFSSTYIDSGLAQFCSTGALCLSPTQKADASGQKLVDYLRGDKTYQDTSTTSSYFRERKHILGDVVSAEAVYMGKYLFDYGTNNGYPAKGSSRANSSVYLAANDGMLHALDSANGNERWSYIPSMAMKSMFRLADKDYATKHRFFVDGTPIAGDLKVGGSWKTILVGGLAGGGPGYYALDITDQTDPKVLWELRQKPGCTAGTSPRYTTASGVTEDCDLGYSYGNPLITKLPNGTWVVMVTSGYNNHTNGDGKGYLYILNPTTGAVLYKTTTNVGDTTTPSGLGHINAWADDAMVDNTAKYVYGGDNLGNLWKFDLTSGAVVVSKLFAAGASKPITAKPELGEVVKNNGQKKRVIFFPTGRLVGNVDLADTSQQSFYGIWDKDSGALPTTVVSATATSGGNGRTGTVLSSVFEDDNNLGWKLDFPDTGERGNTDPQLAFGTLVFTTNKPSTSDACNPSGFTSWVYNIDYLSGGVVEMPATATNNNTQLATAYSGASTRPNIVVLPNGVVKSITRTSGQNVVSNVEDVRIKSSSGSARRVTWRELMN